jgi:hypothetical protein
VPEADRVLAVHQQDRLAGWPFPRATGPVLLPGGGDDLVEALEPVGPHPRDGPQRPLGQQRGGGVPRERASARRLAHRAVAGEQLIAERAFARGGQRADAALVAQAPEQAAQVRGGRTERRLVEVDEREARGAEDRVLGVRVAVQAHALLGVVVGGGEGVGELRGVEGDVGPDTAYELRRVRQLGGRQALEVRERRRRPAMQGRQSRPERRERGRRRIARVRVERLAVDGSMTIAPSAAS